MSCLTHNQKNKCSEKIYALSGLADGTDGQTVKAIRRGDIAFNILV